MSKTIKKKFWLVIPEGGMPYTRKTKPTLDVDEIATQVEIDVPARIYKRPHFNTQIVIPEDAVSTYPIDAELTDNIKKAVKEATGFDMNIKVVEPEEDEGERPVKT